MQEIFRSPLQVGSLRLANRMVMPPMATEKSSDGSVTDSLCRYYGYRTGTVGLIITEHAYVHPSGKRSEGQLSASRDEDIPGLTRLAAAVHGKGETKAIAQINHAGQRSGYWPQDRAEIDELVGWFAAAARRVREAGFDGVEIHAAHGYLLNQFYSPLKNDRQDAYSAASLENRLRLHLQVIRAVRDAVGADFPVAMRFGACDYAEGGSVLEEVPQAAGCLAEAGLDMLDVSGGVNGYVRPGHEEPGWFAELSEAAKSAVSIPVLVTGGIRSLGDAEAILQAGKADLIGVGRPLLKHSTWMQEAFEA